MGKSGKNINRDIKFGSSQKAKKFNRSKIDDTPIIAVGGINGVLGPRLENAGVCNAKDLSDKRRGMTKRNYLRYFMKESSCNVRLAMESYVSLKNHCEQMGDCGKAKVKKEKAEEIAS